MVDLRFDSLCAYLRSVFKCTFNKEEFKWNLINDFDISKLDYIKEIILRNIHT